MKLTVSKENIKRAVEKVSIGAGETIAIMISEQTNDRGLNVCMLLSSNGNIQAQTIFVAKVNTEKKQLKAFVSKDFKDLILAMTKDGEGGVELEFMEKEVKVSCGLTKCTLPLKEEGVCIESGNLSCVISMKAELFKKMVLTGGTSYGGTGENYKDSLGMKLDDATVCVVSTSNVNIAKATGKYTVLKGTVPADVITLNAPQLINIANKLDAEDINIGFMENVIAIFDGSDVYLLKHNALNFPYGITSVFKEESLNAYDFSLKISRKQLFNSIQLATITSQEKKKVHIFTRDGKVAISDCAKENESLLAVKELKGEVKEICIGVDPFKMLINTTLDEEVVLRGKNEERSIVYMFSSEGIGAVSKIKEL